MKVEDDMTKKKKKELTNKIGLFKLDKKNLIKFAIPRILSIFKFY